MPQLAPVVEAAETLTPIDEVASIRFGGLWPSASDLTLPGAYPGPGLFPGGVGGGTFPSAAATFPSVLVVFVGLELTETDDAVLTAAAVSELSLGLAPTGEAALVLTPVEEE